MGCGRVGSSHEDAAVIIDATQNNSARGQS